MHGVYLMRHDYLLLCFKCRYIFYLFIIYIYIEQDQDLILYME